MKKIKSSEITSESVYLSRREVLKGMGITLVSAAVLAACGPSKTGITPTSSSANTLNATPATSIKEVDELGDSLTSFDAVTNYNNYYEFTTSKEDVAALSKDFKASPWTLQVGGMVSQPKTYSVDDLIKKFSPEERIYRLRCVEAWSMVIPWQGFSLKKLLAEVEPTNDAKFVRFETLEDPEQMPGQKSGFFPWPYIEGLRLDEAMHDLTILSTGLYGKNLYPQNGAPLRLVVPWKYGFKSIKSIVKIDLVSEMPKSLWMSVGPNEYGFYANVNPSVDHPRWSQGTERRIGETSRRNTLMFNGYEDEVAQLYSGMDLRVNF